MHQISKLFTWFQQYNTFEISIKTKSILIKVDAQKKRLPHLLGLHYTNAYRNERTGLELFNFCKNKTDEEIYALVKKNNPKKFISVVNRVSTFRHCMENLEKAILVENTSTHTRIPCEHFLIETQNGYYFHLGLLTSDDGTSYFSEYDLSSSIWKKVLNTYVLENDERYFSKSLIKEPITSIERYDEASDSYVPFSFNEEKNKVLLAEYNARRSKPSVLAEIKKAKAVIKARDKPEANKTQDKGLEL